MNAKKILLNLLLILLLVLLIGLVDAQEDFAAASMESVKLCPCSNQAYKIAVQNTGAAASSYTVLASGTAKDWVTFNPNKFVLNPGQKGSLSAIVNSECNIEGDYSLEIFIITNKGLTKAVKQNINFSQCYDYDLEQGNVLEQAEESIKFLKHDGSYLICKNERNIIPILITNNENFGNRYRLFLDAPEWALLNVNNAMLDAKKSGIFLINLDAMDADGEFNFKLSAISELGKVQRKKDIDVSVEDCYALELELEKEKDVICGGEDKTYSILIKNPLTLERNVKLGLDAPEWASVGNGSFADLKFGEKKTATLSLSPEDDVSGSFLVNVFAIIENKSKIADEIKIDVVPKWECYKAEIDAKTSINNFYNEDLFFAKVKNNGIKKIDYSVNLEGVSWVSASPKTLELNPGQTGNLNLKINPDKDIEPGTYGVKIILESNDMLYSKNVNIVLKKENEFTKRLKAGIRFYQYYIYLLILLVILVIIFRKPISKSYKKYNVRRVRLRSLKLAREKRAEEKRKEKELEEKEEKRKEAKERKARRKDLENKFKIFFKKHKIWIYTLIFLLIAALGIFLGHYFKLFNAKYLYIYIVNLFYGYQYYILTGAGIAVALVLLFLIYKFIRKKGDEIKAKIEEQKAEKRAKNKKKSYLPHYKILFFILFAIIIYGIYFFGFAKNIKDFFVLYLFYVILGIVMLVLIILLLRFYKPLFKFLRE